MSTLSIGLTGLQVNQRMLDLTGQNIANANTPDYHRQVANLAEIVDGSVNNTNNVGAGVEITNISQSIDQALEQAVNSNSSASSNFTTQLSGLNQMQSYLATGPGTLHDDLSNLFTQLQALEAQPADATQRQLVVSAANDVTTQLNATVSNLNQMSAGLVNQAQTYTQSINTLTAQIAQLNSQIQAGTISNADVNGYVDQRSQALANLSQLINVNTVQQPDGVLNVFSNGVPLVLNNQATTLNTSTNGQNQLVVTSANNQPADVSGGQLGADLTLFNTTLPTVQSQLNTFAQALASNFDSIQATGLGLNGPMTSVTSQRMVSSVTQPLANANPAFPLQAGDLYITVTNQATGQRTLSKVSIDPQTQSLTDVANAISAIPNLDATVNPQTGSLQIEANPGYAFDFTGNLSSSPDTQTITGTTVATIDGQYTGQNNDTLQYSFSGPGTIGVTPTLTMTVTNSAGTSLGTFNVGQGYAAGSDLSTADGVNVKLATGTVNIGDTFSVNVVSKPDGADLLPALGINSFFVGAGAGGLQVNPELLNNPQNLSAGTTGQSGDAAQLTKLIALQNQPVLANQSQSLQQYLEGIIGGVGNQASDTQTNQTASQALGKQLSDQLQSVSGVDSNQELENLVHYQQSYQMSAEFVSVVNQSLQYFYSLLSTSGT